MEGDSKYCENCEKYISSDNFIIHSVHCQRNLQVCKICKETVPKKEMEAHIDEMHIYVSCDNCHEDMQKWKLDDHSELYCKKRPILCEYCDLNFPFDEMKEHTSYCGSRTERCPKCSKYVSLKDQDMHAFSNCNAKVNNVCADMPDIINLATPTLPKPYLPCAVINDRPILINNKIKVEKQKTSNILNFKSPPPKSSSSPEILWDAQNIAVNSKIEGEKQRTSTISSFKISKSPSPEIFWDVDDTTVNSEIEGEKQRASMISSFNIAKPASPPEIFWDTSDIPANIEIEVEKSKIFNATTSRSIKPILPAEAIWDAERAAETICPTCDRSFVQKQLKGHILSCSQKQKECPSCGRKMAAINLKYHQMRCSQSKANSKKKETHKGEEDKREIVEIIENNEVNSINSPIKAKRPNNATATNYDSITKKISPSRDEKETVTSDTVTCEYCDTPIFYERYKGHLKRCMQRKKECSNCAKSFAMPAYKDHAQFCFGNQHTQNYRGFRKQVNSSLGNAFDTLSCEYCGTPVLSCSYEGHVKRCMRQIKQCSNCFNSFMMSTYKIHVQFCFKSEQSQNQKGLKKPENPPPEQHSDKVLCENCNMPILWGRYDRHVKKCLQRGKQSSNSAKFTSLNPYKDQDPTQIGFGNQPSQNRKGFTELGSSSSENISSTVPCEYCDTSISIQGYDSHLKNCKERKKECPHCSTIITMDVYKIHTQYCSETQQTKNG